MSSKSERKKGLGRGLSSFLDVDSFGEIVDKKSDKKEVTVGSNSPNSLPIEHIIPNQNQPRKDFSPDELNSLASSIRETGIIQPILVRKNDERKVTNTFNSPTNLPIEHIIPNQNQPRKDFSPDELSSLE